MESNPDTLAWAVTAVAAQTTGILTLWRRLRYRERDDRDRREPLLIAMRELPSGGEIAEQFGDGGNLVVRVGWSGERSDQRAGA